MEKNKIDLLFSFGSPVIVVGDAEVAAAVVAIRSAELEAFAFWDLPRSRRGDLPFPPAVAACLQVEAKVFVVGLGRTDNLVFAHEYRVNGPDRPLRHVLEPEVRANIKAANEAGWTQIAWDLLLLEGQLEEKSVETPEDA